MEPQYIATNVGTPRRGCEQLLRDDPTASGGLKMETLLHSTKETLLSLSQELQVLPLPLMKASPK